MTNARLGHVKGFPVNYCKGHVASKTKGPYYTVDPQTGCWNWNRRLTDDGYGSWKGTTAHRVMYERKYGPIPPGHDGHHTCENRRCVNPDHIEPKPASAHTRYHHIKRRLSGDLS
jgi:hypothetical protein